MEGNARYARRAEHEALFEVTNPARFATPGWTADEVVVDSVDGQTALSLGLPANASLGE